MIESYSTLPWTVFVALANFRTFENLDIGLLFYSTGRAIAITTASALALIKVFVKVLTLVMLNKDVTPTSNFQPMRLLDPGF